MKIVMLGRGGVGKTTYVSLMYAEMQEGVGGFRVRASDDALHRQFMADAKAIRAGTYPAAAHRRARYDLALSYDSSEVMPFMLRDHRGGVASGRTSGAQDVAELNQDLLDSDGIVVFIDGHALVTEPGAAQQARRLSGHVLRAMKDRPEVTTPLVIAITKCDLIDTNDDKVVEAIITPLYELASAAAGTMHIVEAIIPVSCGPSPENVVVPVLWSLRFGILGMVQRVGWVEYADQAAMAAAARAAAARDRLTDRIVSWPQSRPGRTGRTPPGENFKGLCPSFRRPRGWRPTRRQD